MIPEVWMRGSLFLPGLILAVFGCGSSSGGGGGESGMDGGTSADAAEAPVYHPPFEECAGTGDQPPQGDPVCLVEEGEPADSPPMSIIEHEITEWDGVPAVHITITLNPDFVDNTYGENKVGWEGNHSFNDLVGSDQVSFVAVNADGTRVFDLVVDYLSPDDTECGYSSEGVTKVNDGPAEAILYATSSLARNLNERGYCIEAYKENSPQTDENCTPNPDAPDWDFRVAYEIWLALSAFEPEGFGSAFMYAVHASPSKAGTNTIEVTPGQCPCEPDVDTGECGPPGECVDDPDCADGEFCYEGTCLNVVD
jgi:hypothetical protein